MPRHLLEVRGLSVEFYTARGVVRAVKDVSFHLDSGETLGILGESGSGKSVSSSAIMGLIDEPPGRISGGQILFGGEDLLRITAAERRKINGDRIAMVFQDPAAHLNPVHTVGRQIAETMTLHGVGRREAQERALALAQRVRIPDAARRMSCYPHEFSGGQRQRIMIAMALAMKPEILIADEPTTALDVTVQAEIMDLLLELKAEMGMGLLLISHDLGLLAKVADRLAVMKDGRVVEAGETAAVLRQPQDAYTRQLLDDAPSAVAVRGRLPENDAVLRVENLSRSYAELRALDDISFEMRKGETVAVVGESGSGKSTLTRCLLRLETADSGRVELFGHDLLTLPQRQLRAVRRRMQVVFQDPSQSLNPRMSVGEIISEPWRINPDILPRRAWAGRVAELLELVGLRPEHAERHAGQFSGGQKQRIAIARALAMEPDILICDEAVSALDASIQAQIVRLLQDLQRQLGLSYLFIAHDLPLVRGFADWIIVLKAGRLVEQGSASGIFLDPQHPYTRGLINASNAYELAPRGEAEGDCETAASC